MNQLPLVKKYALVNQKTGEVRTVDAVSERDALYVGFGASSISIINNVYYHGDWMVQEKRG